MFLKNQKTFLTGSILLLFISLSLLFVFGNCADESVLFCTYEFGETYIQPLLSWSVALVIVASSLFLAPSATLHVEKSLLILLPLSVLLLVYTPVDCSRIICFNKETISWFSAGTFLVISLAIIIYTKIQERKKGR